MLAALFTKFLDWLLPSRVERRRRAADETRWGTEAYDPNDPALTESQFNNYADVVPTRDGLAAPRPKPVAASTEVGPPAATLETAGTRATMELPKLDPQSLRQAT